MLVGAFQSIYPISAEEIDAKMQKFVEDGYNIEMPYKSTCHLSYVDEQFCSHVKRKRPYQKEFGFKPVWFFPAPTLADAFAHASLVGVKTPWYFFRLRHSRKRIFEN